MSETTSEGRFSTEIEGLEEATSPDVIRLRDGHEITIKGIAVLGDRPSSTAACQISQWQYARRHGLESLLGPQVHC